MALGRWTLSFSTWLMANPDPAHADERRAEGTRIPAPPRQIGYQITRTASSACVPGFAVRIRPKLSDNALVT